MTGLFLISTSVLMYAPLSLYIIICDLSQLIYSSIVIDIKLSAPKTAAEGGVVTPSGCAC